MASSKTKNKNQLPTILITNDDGITAPGIAALVQVAKEFGNVVVVAPDAPQSGMGHAITIGKPLRLNKVDQFEGVQAYQCSGTPADCVKLATNIVLKGKKPDVCFSGINHGSNASINVIYSGTMSAAMEASIEGIPSVGMSFLDYSFNANFEVAQEVARQMFDIMLSQVWKGHTLFNVNVPNINLSKLKGIKLCRQAKAKWQENFVERKDPMGKNYYWLTGEFVNMDKAKDTDIWALQNNFASLVPVHYDLTDYTMVELLQKNYKK
jgi:5'-nucleotidase